MRGPVLRLRFDAQAHQRLLAILARHEEQAETDSARGLLDSGLAPDLPDQPGIGFSLLAEGVPQREQAFLDLVFRPDQPDMAGVQVDAAVQHIVDDPVHVALGQEDRGNARDHRQQAQSGAAGVASEIAPGHLEQVH